MKRIKNADINFKLNPKRINLKSFSMRFYTVNSKAYFFIKDQDNVVSVEREATIYDDPEVIISGGTVAVDYYLPLDWSDLVQLGEGVLNYRCINNIDDPFFPDLVYNQVVEDTTAYYIDSDIHIDPAEDDKNLIERVVELESNLAVETADREDADVFLSGAVDTEIARAISAETELSERIDAIESGASEALDAEIERAISAETALQDAIDAEEARAIAIENAIRQDLTDESELRSSADTAMWTAINDETTRATSAETAIENKVDVETLRAIGVENAISGNLETYKATNNAALQAETTRATSAETALQSAINDEATARANADTALQTAITNEVSRAREAESGITNSLNAEVTRATGAENALDDKIDAETTRATGAEAALDVKIGTVSGNVITETTRATTAENALSGAIDSISAATSGSVEELDAKIDTVSGNVITEEARAKGVENALSGAIDTLDVRFFDDAKYEDSGNTKVINFYNGNVVKATIDCTDFLVDGMIDDVRIETISGVTYLVIDFNTASGKEDIKIPLTDIFNPANYYTKSETSGATEISSALAEKLAISDFNAYSGAVDTAINSKAAQSDLDALSGTVNGHISDNTIHLTSGDVQSQIDNSISGKANSSDVYLKSETSGATELATAFAGKQDQLIAGENITISGNVISSEGGGCEVEETVVYDRITGGYVDDGGSTKASFVILDYLGDKSTGNYQLAFIVGDTFNNYVNAYIYFDYPNHSSSSTDTGITEYLTVEYVNDIQDFKVTIKPVYQSSVWIKQVYNVGFDMNLLVPFFTINSGSPCTVITTDVVGLSTKIKNIADKSVSNVYLNSRKDNLGLNYSRNNGLGGSSDIRLEDLDGSNNVLKPNIQVGLGTSGWTEVNLSEGNTCNLSDSKVKGFTTFRISGDTTQLNNWDLSIGVGYNGSYTWDYVNWDDNENTFILNQGWGDIFSAATATWDSNTGYLTVSYPETVTVDGEERQTEFWYINSQNCQYGYVITKFEYYAELQQPLKPYVQQLRTDVNTISGQVATKQDTLIAGSNITISGNVISATGGGGGSSYTAGDGIDITNDVISVTGKADSSDVYLKSETSGATELATAFAATQPKLSAGTGISIDANNVISATGGGSITIDSTLDSGSTNAVANSAITNAINAKADKSTAGGGLVISSKNNHEIANLSNQNGLSIQGFYNEIGFGRINNKPIVNQGTSSYENFSLVETSAITTSVTSASTDTQIPSAKAVYDALGSAGGGITSGEVQTMITSATTPIYQTIEDNEEVTAQALNVLNGELANKLDVSAYTPVDLSNYYTKSQTSGATEIATALSGKQDTLSAGTNITIVDNVISATGGGGGKAIEAGRGISITTGVTADTVSFNLPISGGSGTNSIIIGTGESASLTGSLVHGVGSYSNGVYSNVFGYNCFSNGHYSFLAGGYLNNYTEYGVVFGKYNDTTNSPLFSVGNGTDVNTRHNAFEIRENGDIYISSGGTDIKLQDHLGGASGGISSAECQTMIDQSISGKADSSTVDTLSGTVTANTADIATVSGNVNTISGDVATNTANIATVSAATASNTTALGGLKLVKLSQSAYDNLQTKDNNTLYVIVG